MLKRFSQTMRLLFPSFFTSAKDSETDIRRIAIITFWIIIVGNIFAWLGGGINAWWWGNASLATGGFIGFLFGIPKVVQESTVSGGALLFFLNVNHHLYSTWLDCHS